MADLNLYNIPSGADFLKSLVRGLKVRLNDETLGKALILLPTHRACQHLREAFLSEDGRGDVGLLLPDIRPLGEISEDELMLSGEADFLRRVAALPRAMQPTQRRILLAQQIEHMNVPGVSKAQAFLLAADLAHLIDDALIEGCDLNNLAALVPDRYAKHWQQIIEFLKIVHDFWPRILAERDMIDAVDYQQRLVHLLVEHWQKHPPTYPVIAAGSTGSRPATVALLKCIAALPNGAVVLPGLDQHLEEEAWAEVAPSHPQYFLSRLLKSLECGRENVEVWPGVEDGSARNVLLSETMRPAEAADRWRHLNADDIPAIAWEGLEVIEAAQEHEEAFAAALILRCVAGEEEKTAALVTPDRSLARRVGALMRRWNIELDDSAGTPLLETPVGSYLSLLLDLPLASLRPSQLMAFLKHPFAGVGETREVLRDEARKMEDHFFRDMPRGRGLQSWAIALARDATHVKSAAIIETISTALMAFTEDKLRGLDEWAGVLRDAAVRLVADETQLWREQPGEVLASLLESFSSSEEKYECGFADFAEIFRNALREAVVRRPWGQHPRLAILGLLEARLLRFDHVILAGLNEGVWPEENRADPWMSPAMRVDLGCLDLESRIGQMAHDFVQQAAGPHVSILRSKRAGEAPTIPSRWLARLDAVRKLVKAEYVEAPWLVYARAADFCAEMEPCVPPAVKVPLKALPKKLSPSAIELWLRDPYAFYARYVLGLRARNPLDGEFGARERGILIHRALDELAHKYKSGWPPEAQKDFVKQVQNGFAAYGCSAGDIEILSARLADLAEAYWEYERDRRGKISAMESESRGKLPMQVDDYSFTLEARADRVDVLKTGGLSILDYKTTTLPSGPEIKAGLRPQLYVEAVMGDSGGFTQAPAQKTDEVVYVHFDQAKGKVKGTQLPLEADDVENIHRSGLENFIRAFLDKEARYHAAPRPQLLNPSPDYARLARVSEWSKGSVVQEEGEA